MTSITPFSVLKTVSAWLIVLALSAGCGDDRSGPYVSLKDKEPLRTVTKMPEREALRLATAGMTGPEKTSQRFAPLVRYLTDQLGRPVELVQRRSSAEVNDLFAAGEVDIAFVSTLQYVRGSEGLGMELLAVPVVEGKSEARSAIIVPTASPAQSVEDLRGKTFTFTDPQSVGGWLYPVSVLRRLGTAPKQFFSQYLFTYSHENAIRMVRDGLVDGAAVNTLALRFALLDDPRTRAGVRVIRRSAPFPAPPVVVRAGLDPALKAELRAAMLELKAGELGWDALAALNVDSFVRGNDHDYDTVRQMVREYTRG